MPTRNRSLAALLAAAAFAVPIFVSLGTTVPATRRIPLGPPETEERSAGFSADLRGRWTVERDGHFYQLRIPLKTTDPGRLLAHHEIGLEVLPYAGVLDLEDGRLSFDGTSCAYWTKREFVLPTDGLLTLQRRPGCVHMEGTPDGGLMLTLRLRTEGRAALRTAARPDAPAGALLVSTFAIENPPGVLLARGTLADPDGDHPGARRLTLVAYVWRTSMLAIVIWILAAAGAIVAAVLLASRPASATASAGEPVIATASAGEPVIATASAGEPVIARASAGGPAIARASAGGPAMAAFLAALGLASAYAIVIPPFQGADEPNHFLTLCNALGRPELADEGAAWGRVARFEELRSAGRGFTPVDRGVPGRPWVGIAAPDAARGGGASALWMLLAPALRRASAPGVLLTLRLFHALIFAAAVGLFVLVASRLTDARQPILLALPIFLVPTLPYFGMHLSNYAPLVALYVLFAAAVAVALWDGPEAHWAAPLLGCAITLGLALSRSALPLAGLAAGVVLARLCLGDVRGNWRHSVIYWALLTATTVVGLSLANLAYPEGPERAIIRYDIAHGRLAWLLHNPWWLALPGAALAGVEIAISPLARRLSRPSTTRMAAVQVTAYAAAIAMAAWVLVSPWLTHPVVIPIDRIRITSIDETLNGILPALLAWPRFGRPDILTSVTFWGGFGWLEKLLPEGFVSALAGASGLAFAALLAWVGSRRSGRALVWIGCATGGYVVSAFAYAYTARLIFTEVHGRYLLGLYLAALVMAWSVVARWGRGTRLAAAGVLALHAWTLTFLLGRYYF